MCFAGIATTQHAEYVRIVGSPSPVPGPAKEEPLGDVAGAFAEAADRWKIDGDTLKVLRAALHEQVSTSIE